MSEIHELQKYILDGLRIPVLPTVNVDLTGAYKSLAELLGKDVEELSNVEKQMAMFQAVVDAFDKEEDE